MRPLLACVLTAAFLSSTASADVVSNSTSTANIVEQEVAADIAITPVRAIDAVDLAAYVDGLVNAGMQSDHIAGVTVAIVDRHGPLLLRGYGIAGQSPRREVDPDSTLFRIASISKTFTYLLALQMIDDGRLDADATVNNYLPADLQLPDDGYAAILVRHLFSHSAGYEDSAMGHLFVDDPSRVVSLEEYVRNHRPKRVREPGIKAVYSNYSLALLGVIVSHVSGLPFDRLVNQQLLQPTGMLQSTFREPFGNEDPRNAGPTFEGNWSQGFRRRAGGYQAQKFEYASQIAPVGGGSSSAEDMGRYMRMLLNDGRIDGNQVLAPTVLARLYSEPQFRNAPQVGGFSWGFFAEKMGELEVYGHGGATQWFHSAMQLVPEQGLGIFISTNTDTGRRFAGEFPRLVIERYFQQARSSQPPASPESFDTQPFVGSYNSERTNYSSIEKLFLSSTLDVAATAEGALVITGGPSTLRYVADGPMSFREVEGPGHITFLTDANGNVQSFANAKGHVVYDRVPAWGVLAFLTSAAGVIGVIAVFVLSGAWLRLGNRIGDKPRARWSARWLYFTAVLWIIFVVSTIALQRVDETELFYSFPGPLVRFIAWLSVSFILASLINPILLGSAWKAKGWGFWRKLRHTLAVLAFLVGAFLLWYWNLLPWKL